MAIDPSEIYYNRLGYYDTITQYYTGKTPYYPIGKDTRKEFHTGIGQATITLGALATPSSIKVWAIASGGLASGAVRWIAKDATSEAADTWQFEISTNAAGSAESITARTVFDYGTTFMVEYDLEPPFESEDYYTEIP